MLEDVTAAYLIIAPLVASAALVGLGLWIVARRVAIAHAQAKIHRTRPGRRGLD
jgi:type IV secretory pathway TrbD component